MMGRGKYLLDTNVLISAKNSYYSFKLCPGFWDCLIHYSKKERICSIDKVRDEIQKGNDDLVLWVNKLNDFFHDVGKNKSTSSHYKEIIGWTTHNPNYTTGARDRFARGADPWLIAFAKAKSLTLVTHEKSNLHQEKKNNSQPIEKIKIPDVCNWYKVNYVNTFRMLHDLDVQFKWSERYDF